MRASTRRGTTWKIRRWSSVGIDSSHSVATETSANGTEIARASTPICSYEPTTHEPRSRSRMTCWFATVATASPLPSIKILAWAVGANLESTAEVNRRLRLYAQGSIDPRWFGAIGKHRGITVRN